MTINRRKPYYEQALALAQEEGDQNIVMINTSNLGGVYTWFWPVPVVA